MQTQPHVMSVECLLLGTDGIHDRRDIQALEQGRKILAGFLEEAGFAGGPFKMWPIKKETGRPAKQNRITNYMPVNERDIHLVIQPGDNGTAWRFRLGVPIQLTAQQVHSALHRVITLPKAEPQVREVAAVQHEAVVESAAEAKPANVGTTQVAPPVKTAAPEMTLQVLLADFESAALAMAEAFSDIDSFTPEDELVEVIQEQTGWPVGRASQVVLAFINRECLSRITRDGQHYVRAVSEELRSKLLAAGVKPARRPEQSPTPAAPERPRPHLVASSSSSPAPKPTPAQTPAPKKVSRTDNITRLQKLASDFSGAQQKLRNRKSEREALTTAVASAERKLAESKARLDAFDKEGEEYIHIVSDPEHTEAQAKLDQIKSLLDS